uniref:DoxX family protein n=1 Tax=Bursaphelenchus xylophilus TaxID=6326 RepID=A0A1I7SI87_BURXY
WDLIIIFGIYEMNGNLPFSIKQPAEFDFRSTWK